MKAVNKQKVKTISVILTVLLFLGSKQKVLAEEDHLIVRIVDADYPPSSIIFTDDHFTGFEFRIYLEIENPTQSNINITYWCSPLPYPHLRTNLENKSLETTISSLIEPLSPKNYSMPPGIEERYHYAAILIFNYESSKLPLGEYEIWYDYTNCSYTYVPVITHSMLINVTEENISYIFEYNNETEVVFTTQYTETTSFDVMFFTVLALILFRTKKRSRKKQLS